MREYILGEKDEEIEPLKFQHGIWSEETSFLWSRAGIKTGMKGMDAGRGPGFASMELAELLGEEGSLTAFDGTQKYLSYLESQIEKQSIKNIIIQKGDILDTSLPDNHFDFIYTRMVLIYISDLDAALTEFKRILKPGGMLLIGDFYDYEKFCMNADAPEFKKLVGLITSDFEEQQADLRVGKKMVRLVGEKGFKIENIKAECKVAFPDSDAWQWPQGFYENYIPSLLKRKKITSEQVDDFWKEWKKLSSDRLNFFLGPAFLSIFARK